MQIFKETYSFNVQANSFFDFNKNKGNETTSTPQPNVNNVNQDTFYGLNQNNRNNSTDENSVQSSSPQNNEQKMKTVGGTDQEVTNAKNEKKSRRRGVWKRVRVRPVDSFETAESQNIGKHLYNTLTNDNIKEFGERNTKKVVGLPSNEFSDTRTQSDSYNLFDDSEFNDDDDEDVQTVLPIETTTKPDDDEFTTTDFDLIDTSNEVTTEQIDTKDERELEATSTVSYNSNDMDDLTTTQASFVSFDSKKDAQPSSNDDENKEKRSDELNDDQMPESSSIMDEVKQKLTELFSFEDDDVVVTTTERVFKFNRNFKRPKSTLPLYTSIDRNPLVNDIAANAKDSEKSQMKIKSSPASMKLEPVPVLKTILRPIPDEASASSTNFHKDLMDSVIYATSTSTEISHETEICYRGRCVKTQKKP